MRKSALSFLILGIAACTRHTYTSAGGSVAIDQKGKDASSMTFTGRDGKQVSIEMNTGSMPSDYPRDVPVYKDARVVMAQSMSEKHGRHVMLETSDPAAKIVDYYKRELGANGWKIEANMSTPAMDMITAAKDKRQLVVQVIGNNEKRSINQTVADKD
ncbi:MAG: hypothetical protein ACR2I2_08130 [Bryobacteraceae bacterium]